MSDHIEWACERVGWKTLDGAIVDPRELPDGCPPKSTADLAEALRVKFIGMGFVVSDETADIALEWLFSGPEAFIAAVREVCDD